MMEVARAASLTAKTHAFWLYHSIALQFVCNATLTDEGSLEEHLGLVGTRLLRL